LIENMEADMARKPRSKAGTEAGAIQPEAVSSGPPKSTRDAIIDALMELAAERRWDDIDLRDIAQRANLSLAEFRDHFPSKGAILSAFSRRIDKEVLEGTTGELADEPVRERVFDVMMRRIDALAPYKTALERIADGVRGDPMSLAALNQVAVNSQRFMLAAADVDTSGPLGAVKVQGAVLVFARVLDTWFRDDDPGLAATMAALDRELRRGGRILEGLSDLYRLTTPFRALMEAAAEGGRRFRSRERAGRDRRHRGDDDDYAMTV
jgi:AcrR family transcriptional regulator